MRKHFGGLFGDGGFDVVFLLSTVDDNLGYDVTYRVVIRAGSEEEARQLAAKAASFEHDDMWLDSLQTRCEVIPSEGPPEIICVDHRSA